MADTHFTVIFAVVGLFILSMLSPGPNFVMVVRSSLLGGRAAGVATGLGVVMGNACYGLFGFFGLAAIASQGDWLLSIFRILGALYLIRLGLVTLRRNETLLVAEIDAKPGLPKAAFFRAGLLTDLANPQSLAFFMGTATALVRPDVPYWVLPVTLGSILAVSTLWRIGLAFLFSTTSIRRVYPRLSRYANPVIGVTLLVFGGGMLVRG